MMSNRKTKLAEPLVRHRRTSGSALCLLVAIAAALLTLPLLADDDYILHTTGGDGCAITVIDKDSTLITLATTATCPPLAEIYRYGFIIDEMREQATILWGRFSMYATFCDYGLVDIDKDGNNEVITAFFDESTLWGHLHRIVFDSLSASKVQSLEIPQSFHTPRRYGSEEEFYHLRSNGDLVLHAHYILETDSGMTWGDSVVVTYDPAGDSLAIK